VSERVNILGLNAYHADAAATLVIDGQIVAAAEEERFNRIKHAAGFPTRAVRYCLKSAGLGLADLHHIAIASKPIEHVQQEILQILSGRPNYSRQIRKRFEDVARFRDIRGILCQELGIEPSAVRAEFHEIEHHLSHLASAYYLSGFETCALLSLDGFGDFCSTMTGRGQGGQIEIADKVLFPHSLGAFYTMITQFLGFRSYGDEGKVMGLAAHGEPNFVDQLEVLIRLTPNGLFELSPDYFTHPVYGVDMIWLDRVPTIEDIFTEKMIETFGTPRVKYAPYSKRDEDLAASAQVVLEKTLIHVASHLQRKTGLSDLAYAGGVALNCLGNTLLLERSGFKRVFIPPAAGDSGTALGCALLVANQAGEPGHAPLTSARLGPSFSRDEVDETIARNGLRCRRPDDIASEVAKALASGKIVGWFEGRLEFGPRALGGRSILADPRNADMRNTLNSRIKYREPFRPFAASVLEEYAGEWFEGPVHAPFMLFAYPARAAIRQDIPAVVHRDGTCRIQTVSREQDPAYHALISAFHKETGVPLVLNTSFNENEPIVCTPGDAIECFMSTRMDLLAMEGALISR
jgi:carbamoyltransferase